MKCDWCGKEIVGEPLIYRSQFFETTKTICPDDCVAKSAREIAEVLRK